MTVVFGGVSQLPPVPPAGTSGQVLAKASGTNYDLTWIDAGGGSSSEGSATFTYTGDRLDRIDYVSGNYKEFTYTGTQLDRVDYVQGATTLRKDFTYSGGLLTAVTVSTF
jgi:hypothetical protein